jgi:Ca-activated chloride channel homolog
MTPISERPPEPAPARPSRRLALARGALLAASAGLAGWLYAALGTRSASVELLGARYELLEPRLLAAAALVLLLPLGLLASLSDLPRVQRALSTLIRAGLLLLLALALARPALRLDATRVSAVLLVDVSDSVSDAGLDEARALVSKVQQARGDNDLRLVTFARRPRAQALDATHPVERAVARHGAGEPGERADSDLQAALQLSYGLVAPGHLRRVLLISDGKQTRGDLLAEAERARSMHVRLDHALLAAGGPPEVALGELSVPDALHVGESFELHARVLASYPTRARLRLLQDGIQNGLDGVRDVELVAGENEVVFRSIARTPGQVGYRLELQPSAADHFRENNVASAVAVVPGRARVLLADEEPGQLRDLAQALSVQDFDVDVRGASALPRTLAELSAFDFVVISDLPADRVPAESMEAIERYVRDLGGGFMLAGGPHSFGLGGYQGTRMEDLLPVRMESERRRDEHSLALALVIDCSGSMSGQKIELAKDAAKAAAELLGPQDALSVIGFSSEPERVVRMQGASNRMRIAQSIGKISAQGGTAIFPALDLAFQDLLTTSARVKHVILLTDGQTQENGIPELVHAMRAEGMTVSTVGLGTDVNRSLLQQSASVGGGRAYFTDDPHNVPRIFVNETTSVGQNSAVEDLVRALPHDPADFLRGIDLASAPLLRGYIATGAKPRPAQVVLISELGDPLLARWRVGLGWVLAWTSDWKPRWASEWLRWKAFPAFTAQLVREHMRAQDHTELPLHAELLGNEVRVSVDAIGPDDRFLDGLASSVTLEGPLDPAADRLRVTRPLLQRAPGRYEARFPLERYGSFALHAEHKRDGRVVARSRGQLSHPYPPEYAPGPPDRALLARASGIAGGQALSSAARLFDPGAERVATHRELWPELVLAALLLFLFDVLLRRVRWPDRETR